MSRFTKEDALGWKARKQFSRQAAPGAGNAVRFIDFSALLANHRRGQELTSSPLLTIGFSDAIFAAAYPGEEMPHWRRGFIQYVALLETRQLATEADQRCGTTKLANDLLDTAEIVPTMSDESLLDLFARFGTPRLKGAPSIYGRHAR